MAVNPATSVFASNHPDALAAVVNVDINTAPPSRPTDTVAKAMVVVSGGSLDPTTGAFVAGGSPGANTGSVRVASSAASGNPAVAKASAGRINQFWGQNAAAITYLQIYNKATAPTLGSDTPILTYPIPASAAFAQTIPSGLPLSNGVAYAFTTDAAGTTGAAAAAVTAFNLFYS